MCKAVPNTETADDTVNRLLEEISSLDVLALSRAEHASELAERFSFVSVTLENLCRARTARARDTSWDLEQDLLDEMHECGGIGKGQIGDGSSTPIQLPQYGPSPNR